ncbi:MAG: hypothetical protein KDD37_05915, partial [Bdellovibrionales bacterium]|nr:hypothetical protein [Bdellovibrionales bacterium]
AMMEVGATICLPQNPNCLLCPFQKNCVARKQGTQSTLPLKKDKKKNEIWHIQLFLLKNKNKIAFHKNQTLPFLKDEMLWPLEGKKLNVKPKEYHFRHSVTHHEIYVEISQTSPSRLAKNSLVWIQANEIKKISPFSLTTKAITHAKTMGLLDTSNVIHQLPKRTKARSRSKSFKA